MKIIPSLIAILLAVVPCATAGSVSYLDQLQGSAFGYYAVMVGGSANNALQGTSDTYVYGNMAVGAGIPFQSSGTLVTGNLDFVGSNTTQSSVIVDGTTSINSSQAAAAITQAQNLASTYASLTSGTDISSTNSLNVSTTAGTVYNGDDHVYTLNHASSFNSGNGGLTITASASQYVIINVLAGTNSNFNMGAITLAGGITSDHVLFNILSTGQLSAANAHSLDINAIIIDNSGSVNIDNTTINGRLYCTTAPQNCQLVSGLTVNSTVDVAAEPMSFVLIGSGLMLVWAARRFRPDVQATANPT